jgi:hypothetical protein
MKSKVFNTPFDKFGNFIELAQAIVGISIAIIVCLALGYLIL